MDLTKSVEINSWKKGPSGDKIAADGKPKEVFRLFPEVFSIKECIDDFVDSIDVMKVHRYVTKWQWKNQRIKIESLKAGDIITVEDYQMNVSVELSEAPTTSIFGANQLALTLYPIIVFFRYPAGGSGTAVPSQRVASLACEDDNRVQEVRDVSIACDDDNRLQGVRDVAPACEDGEVKKAAIAFISDDRGHGWEQIEDFNKRTFEILSEFGLELKNCTILSGGCESQYKSKNEADRSKRNDGEKY